MSTEPRDIHSDDPNVYVRFGVIDNNAWYRVWRKPNASTYFAQLAASNGKYYYSGGNATIHDAADWAVKKAANLDSQSQSDATRN